MPGGQSSMPHGQRRREMRFAIGVALVGMAVVAIGAQQQAGNAVAIDNDDIGGLVTSTKGPEAGVWVIAETRELPTRFARIVVPDHRGRYRSEERRVGKECRSRWSPYH